MRTSLIVAATDDDVIGRDGDLPWYLPEDLRRFKALTAGHVVVVGRKTHESIINRLGKPLPGRISVVVSRARRSGADTVIFETSVKSALSVARAIEAFAGRDEVFVIGGAQVYAEALPEVDRIYLTRVHQSVDGDAGMPADWLKGFTLVGEERGDTHSFLIYER